MRSAVTRPLQFLSGPLFIALFSACSSGAPGTLSPNHATELLLSSLKGGAYEVNVTAIEKPVFLSDRSEVTFDWTFHPFREAGDSIAPVTSQRDRLKTGHGRAEFDRERSGWSVKSLHLDVVRPIS